MRIRNILVPTDFSAASVEAWRYAQALAVPFKSRIHLLHCIAPPYLYDAWATDTLPLRVSDFLAQAQVVAGKQLVGMMQRAGRLRHRVTTTVRSGPTVNEILDAIRTKHIDVVVMGTHGHSLVGQLLLGRVAERVVQRSPVPVITVHGQAAKSGRSRKRTK